MRLVWPVSANWPDDVAEWKTTTQAGAKPAGAKPAAAGTSAADGPPSSPISNAESVTLISSVNIEEKPGIRSPTA